MVHAVPLWTLGSLSSIPSHLFNLLQYYVLISLLVLNIGPLVFNLISTPPAVMPMNTALNRDERFSNSGYRSSYFLLHAWLATDRKLKGSYKTFSILLLCLLSFYYMCIHSAYIIKAATDACPSSLDAPNTHLFQTKNLLYDSTRWWY